MKKILAFFIVLFSGYEKFLKKEKKSLRDLQVSLRAVQFTSNYVESLLKLFEVLYLLKKEEKFHTLISELEKRNYGQIKRLVSAMKSMQAGIEAAWSDEVNQTLPNRTPDEDTIYLSGSFRGMRKRPLGYFLKNNIPCQQEVDLRQKEVSEIYWQYINNITKNKVFDLSTKILDELEKIKRYL